MRGSLESIIKHMIKLNNHKSNISFPAIVVNTDNLADGFIDVKPLVNNMNSVTGETIEYPPIRNVQVLMPSTMSSSIVFPVKQGDTVDLLFQSVDIVDFVNGEKESHDPFGNGWGNLANVVAIIGFNPYQESPFNSNNYSNDFDNQDLNIVHNKNTGLESSLNISTNGSILQKAPNAVTVDSPLFDVKSDLLNANNAIITTGGDVVVRGQSLNEFMLKAPIDLKGRDGDKGWSPVFSVEDRNPDESVLKITDWVGGEGDKPSEVGYIGSDGLVEDILDAINIKGARGSTGSSGASLSADVIQDIVNDQFTVGAILDLIQGQIDESALTAALTSKIEKIDYNELAISMETQARVDSVLGLKSAISKETEARVKDILDANTKIDGTNTQFVEFKDVVTDKFGTQGEKLEGIVADYKPQYADKNHFADSSRSVQWTYWKTVARDNYATNERVTKLQSDVKDSNATITQSLLTLVTKEEAISQTIDNLSVKTNNNTASITDIRETVTNGLSSQAERIETMEVDYKPQYANKNQYASATRSVQWTYWKTVAKDNYAANERITQLKSEVGENNSSVTQSINTLVTKDESIAKSVDNLRATTNGSISAIKTELSSTTSKTNATASSVSTLQTTVRGNTASIQVAQSSIDGINLQYTVKLDSGGKISGFGMMNDGVTSAFDVRADRFSISPPVGKPNDVSGSSPFMVITTPTTINGIFVDSGVYMRKAYIARASIDRAHIKDLAVDTLQINGNAVTIPRYIEYPTFPKTYNWNIRQGTGFEFASGGLSIESGFVSIELFISKIWLNIHQPTAQTSYILIFADGVLLREFNIGSVSVGGTISGSGNDRVLYVQNLSFKIPYFAPPAKNVTYSVKVLERPDIGGNTPQSYFAAEGIAFLITGVKK